MIELFKGIIEIFKDFFKNIPKEFKKEIEEIAEFIYSIKNKKEDKT